MDKKTKSILLMITTVIMLAIIGLIIWMVAGQGSDDGIVEETVEGDVSPGADEVDVKSAEVANTSDNAEDTAVVDPAEEASERPERNLLPLENLIRDSDTTFSFSYDGIEHSCIEDLAETTQDGPLVLLLHGYGQSAEMIRSTTHFEEAANPLGYSVVYVTGATDPADPTSSTGWNAGNGNGTNKDTDMLCALASYLQEEYGFDKNRCYAAGFSNGAFMNHRLAVEAGDVFSAVVSVAGMMPAMIWDEKDMLTPISVFQVSGEKDDLIPKNSDGSAKYSTNPAIEDVLDQYKTVDGLTEEETTELEMGSTLTKYSSPESKQQVWHLFIKGGHHGWPSLQINKVDTNALIMEFLETQK